MQAWVADGKEEVALVEVIETVPLLLLLRVKRLPRRPPGSGRGRERDDFTVTGLRRAHGRAAGDPRVRTRIDRALRVVRERVDGSARCAAGGHDGGDGTVFSSAVQRAMTDRRARKAWLVLDACADANDLHIVVPPPPRTMSSTTAAIRVARQVARVARSRRATIRYW